MILRPMHVDDAEELSTLADCTQVWEHTQPPPARTLEEWRGLLDVIADKEWTFTAEHDGEIVGAFSLLRADGQYAHRAELGGWLGKPYWGKGFASQAFRQLIRFGEAQGLQRIETRGAEDNPASVAAVSRAGMRLESRMPCGIMRGERLLCEFLYVWIKGVDESPR